MRKLWGCFGLVVALAFANPVHSAASPAYLDPLLTQALATSAPTSELQAVAVFAAPPLPPTLSALAATGATAVPFHTLPMVALQGTPSQMLAASSVSGVQSMWLNHPLELMLRESVPLIQADAVHAAPLGITGRGVRVATIDSGIDGFHPDLHYPEHTVQNVKLLGYQKVFSDLVLTQENVPNTDTTAGHGTHVAGIIAGTGAASAGYYTGVAPGAQLVGLGAADGTDLLTGVAAYDWVLAHKDAYGIRVINNSWGDGTITYDPNDPLNKASLAAHDAGITVVFAAGNDGQTGGMVYNRYAWPSWVIGVGGGTKTGKIDTYSSAGDDVHHPDVVAPGSFIASARAITGVVTDANSTPFDFTDPLAPRMVSPENNAYYTVALGTSMAAPHVSGVVALMLEANPALTPDQMRGILNATATPISGCPVGTCGSGYVNALGAVRAAIGMINRAPVASLSALPATGAAPLTVTLDASASYDPDAGGYVASYQWDFEGDGVTDTTSSVPVIGHAYAAGVYHPTVVAVDQTGAASTPVGSVEVRSANPPHADASAPKHGKSGNAVTFDASASASENGAMSYRFSFGDGTSVTSASAVVTHVYAITHPTLFAWSVTVTDGAGLSDASSDSIKITP